MEQSYLRILLKKLFRSLEQNIWNSNYGTLQIGAKRYLMNWKLIWWMANGSMTAEGSTNFYSSKLTAINICSIRWFVKCK